MDIQTIHARFSTQEEAEAAVRKLASLRGDRFRLEREGAFAQVGTPAGDADPSVEARMTGNAIPSYSGVMLSADTAGDIWGDGIEGASTASFTLSANVPVLAADQARSVILGAGGQMM